MTQKKYIYEMPLRVRDYEVDSQGIVNNAVYLHYLEHTRHEFCREAGTSFREMSDNGLDPVLRKLEIEYHRPLGLGEEFVSRLSLRREGVRFIFDQDIYSWPGEEIVVKAVATIVCTRNGRITRGEELAEAFGEYLF